jgi:hypothetical protein
MNWGQIDLSWIQLKDKIVFQWGRLTDGDGKRVLSWGFSSKTKSSSSGAG